MGDGISGCRFTGLQGSSVVSGCPVPSTVDFSDAYYRSVVPAKSTGALKFAASEACLSMVRLDSINMGNLCLNGLCIYTNPRRSPTLDNVAKNSHGRHGRVDSIYTVSGA